MDINNLMENIRSFFTEQYKGAEKSDCFISFEPLGCMLDPADFKDENNQVSDTKATEQLSVLSDRVPEIDEVFLPATGRISTVYETLIESSVFTGERISSGDKAPYIARFGELKSDSLLRFSEGRKASLTMPEGTYMPVYGYPKKWYDPTGTFWVNKTFTAAEPTPSSLGKPLLGKAIFAAWRTKLMVNAELLQPVAIKTAKKETSPASAISLQAKVNMEPAINRALHLKSSSLYPSAAIAGVQTSKKTAPVAAADKQLLPIKDLNLLKKISFSDRVNLTRNILKEDSSTPAKLQSDMFSMSFDYCIVYLERPWFNTALFSYTNLWYCLSLEQSFFSTGAKDENNRGLLKCIPTAMILIKNLHLKAEWTEDDKNKARNSIGLGVFNLNESSFINNELVTPGMQILGWICEVMPKLPANSDPNINF